MNLWKQTEMNSYHIISLILAVANFVSSSDNNPVKIFGRTNENLTYDTNDVARRFHYRDLQKLAKEKGKVKVSSSTKNKKTPKPKSNKKTKSPKQVKNTEPSKTKAPNSKSNKKTKSQKREVKQTAAPTILTIISQQTTAASNKASKTKTLKSKSNKKIKSPKSVKTTEVPTVLQIISQETTASPSKAKKEKGIQVQFVEIEQENQVAKASKNHCTK